MKSMLACDLLWNIIFLLLLCLLEQLTKPPTKGLILESYGSGNAPQRKENFLRVLREASARGVVIVAITQCLTGTVLLDRYATGRALRYLPP